MSFETQRVFKFLRHRLRGEGVDDATVARLIEECTALAPKLGIEDDSELIRLIQLQFRFSKAKLEDKTIQDALGKTLAQSQWTMAQRLDFVDQQLVGRAPDPKSRLSRSGPARAQARAARARKLSRPLDAPHRALPPSPVPPLPSPPLPQRELWDLSPPSSNEETALLTGPQLLALRAMTDSPPTPEDTQPLSPEDVAALRRRLSRSPLTYSEAPLLEEQTQRLLLEDTKDGSDPKPSRALSSAKLGAVLLGGGSKPHKP